jgi:hypothetical protein
MIYVENQEPTSLIDGGWFGSCDDCRWQSGDTRPRARLAGQPTCKLWPWARSPRYRKDRIAATEHGYGARMFCLHRPALQSTRVTPT